jgi:phosphonate transport system substrate-binding protein
MALRKTVWISSCVLSVVLSIAGCSGPLNQTGTSQQATETKTLRIGAIPDQDPEKLQRLYGKLAQYLTKELKVPVVYKPVTDYAAAVTAFKVGDLDLVWFGGLTGVQAQTQVPGADAIAQRDVDAKFRSAFIANKKSGIAPFMNNMQGLKDLKGHTFTFGSESSTSGRLMPQYFLQKAGVNLSDFKGEVGFSKSHDATLELVQAGTYDAGVLNQKVWESRLQDGKADPGKVDLLYLTPTYYDYHWVIHPSVKQRFGNEFPKKVQTAFLKLSPAVPEQKEILELFTAEKFIPTQNSNYAQIEQIGREIGKIK